MHLAAGRRNTVAFDKDIVMASNAASVAEYNEAAERGIFLVPELILML